MRTQKGEYENNGRPTGMRQLQAKESQGLLANIQAEREDIEQTSVSESPKRIILPKFHLQLLFLKIMRKFYDFKVPNMWYLLWQT